MSSNQPPSTEQRPPLKIPSRPPDFEKNGNCYWFREFVYAFDDDPERLTVLDGTLVFAEGTYAGFAVMSYAQEAFENFITNEVLSED